MTLVCANVQEIDVGHAFLPEDGVAGVFVAWIALGKGTVWRVDFFGAEMEGFLQGRNLAGGNIGVGFAGGKTVVDHVK